MFSKLNFVLSIIYWATKKALQKYGSRTWCTKNPFGYRQNIHYQPSKAIINNQKVKNKQKPGFFHLFFQLNNNLFWNSIYKATRSYEIFKRFFRFCLTLSYLIYDYEPDQLFFNIYTIGVQIKQKILLELYSLQLTVVV